MKKILNSQYRFIFMSTFINLFNNVVFFDLLIIQSISVIFSFLKKHEKHTFQKKKFIIVNIFKFLVIISPSRGVIPIF